MRLFLSRPMWLTLGVLALLPARAGCVADCRDEFDSAVQHCKLMWDDPDESDDLEMCLQDAKSQYQDCIEECKS